MHLVINHIAIINSHLKIRKAVDDLVQAVRHSLLAKLIERNQILKSIKLKGKMRSHKTVKEVVNVIDRIQKDLVVNVHNGSLWLLSFAVFLC
jgi:hypothetical protein